MFYILFFPNLTLNMLDSPSWFLKKPNLDGTDNYGQLASET